MAFTYWSAERDDILRRDWPNDMPRAQIKPLIDALPGPAVPLGRISKRALELGLRRGPEFYQVRAAMGAAASRLRQTLVTPERDVLLAKLWAEGVARADVIAQLNALPGKLVTDRFRGSLGYSLSSRCCNGGIFVFGCHSGKLNPSLSE